MSFSLYIDCSGLVEGLEKHRCLKSLHDKVPCSERASDTRSLPEGLLKLVCSTDFCQPTVLPCTEHDVL